jgi:serpin B
MEIELEPDVKSIVSGNTRFAVDLYHELKGTEGNLFFSPYSLSVALAMTYAGARGRTKGEMATALRFSLPEERLHAALAALRARLDGIQNLGQVQLSVANSLWPQAGYPFLADYLALLEEHYGVAIRAVDYAADPEAARRTINAWVAASTRDKIAELIRPGVLDALTRLVLANAVYFKGDWAGPFDADLTQEAPFWIMPERSVPTPMMSQTRSLPYAQKDGLHILELPYTGNDLSMVVLLPGAVGGLSRLEKDLTVERLDAWMSGLAGTEVAVSLPRFKTSSHFRLDAALAAMGMPLAFDSSQANFAGMDGRRDWLYIGAVLHQAFVDVNEEGTEAAAATAVVMKVRSLSPPPVVFQADHPFIFLIRDRGTDSILFLGRVVNPLL